MQATNPFAKKILSKYYNENIVLTMMLFLGKCFFQVTVLLNRTK